MKKIFSVLVWGVVLAQAQSLRLHDQQSNSADALAQTPSTQPDPAKSAAGRPTSSVRTEAVRTESSGENSNPESNGIPALQAQIQEALRKEPTLTNDNVVVTAIAEGVELTGSVASSRERQNAERLAQSYTRGKKVVNHIVVSGRNGDASPLPDGRDKANADHSANFTASSSNANGQKNPPR